MDPPLERVDDYFWMRDDKRESKVGARVLCTPIRPGSASARNSPPSSGPLLAIDARFWRSVVGFLRMAANAAGQARASVLHLFCPTASLAPPLGAFFFFFFLQEVLGHIKKENAYTEEKMEHLKGLREDLYKVPTLCRTSVIPAPSPPPPALCMVASTASTSRIRW